MPFPPPEPTSTLFSSGIAFIELVMDIKVANMATQSALFNSRKRGILYQHEAAK
jgi:hypothetical protein